MAVNKRFSAQARKHGKRLAIAFFGIIAFAMLFDTISFLATRPLIRDTLLSWGLGERIEDARVSVDSCTTSGHWVYPRRSASYLAYDTDCEITIYVPAKPPYRRIERSQVRLWAPDDGKTVLGAGQVLGAAGRALARRCSVADVARSAQHLLHRVWLAGGSGDFRRLALAALVAARPVPPPQTLLAKLALATRNTGPLFLRHAQP